MISLSTVRAVKNPTPYFGDYAIKDTATEIRKLRNQGIAVLGVFAGAEKDLLAEQKIFGKDFAYIKDIRNFSRVTGAYLKKTGAECIRKGETVENRKIRLNQSVGSLCVVLCLLVYAYYAREWERRLSDPLGKNRSEPQQASDTCRTDFLLDPFGERAHHTGQDPRLSDGDRGASNLLAVYPHRKNGCFFWETAGRTSISGMPITFR